MNMHNTLSLVLVGRRCLAATVALIVLCALCAPSGFAAILIGNGLVSTSGSPLNGSLVFTPISNPLILSHGNQTFGTSLKIQVVGGGFSNAIVAGNYNVSSGPYTVAASIPDTTNIVYFTNAITAGLFIFTNYVPLWSGVAGEYVTNVGSGSLVATHLLTNVMTGSTWLVISNDLSGAAGGGVTVSAADATLTAATNAGNVSLSAAAMGTLLTNLANNIGLNDTNFAKSIGTVVSNWVGVLSTNGSNYTLSVGLVISNAYGVMSTNSTNFTLAGIAALGVNDTNFAQTIGQSLTNWTLTQIAALGVNDTNFAKSIGAAITNYAQAGALSLSNFWTLFGGAYVTNVGSGSLVATHLLTNAVSGTNWLVISNDMSGAGGGGSGVSAVDGLINSVGIVVTNVGNTGSATLASSVLVTNGQSLILSNYWAANLALSGNLSFGGTISGSGSGLSNIPVNVFPYTAYYVDTNFAFASDTNTGLTPQSPFLTVQHALNAASGAAKIILTAGESFNVTNLLWTNSGASSNAPMILESSSTSQATLLAPTGTGITLSNASFVQVGPYLKLQGLTNNISALTNFGDTSGIAAANWSANPIGCIYILNCETLLFASGVNVDIQSTGSITNIIVNSNACHDLVFAGITTWDNAPTNPTNQYIFTNVWVRNNAVSNVYGNYTNGSGSCIALGWVRNGVVESNTLHDSFSMSGGGGAGSTGIVDYMCAFCTNQYNEVWNISYTTNHVDGEGIEIYLYCSNCVCQYNYVHNNKGAGYYNFGSYGNNVFRFNVGYSDLGLGELVVQTTGQMSNTWIYNNTLIQPSLSLPCFFNQTAITTGSNIFANNLCLLASAFNPGRAIVSTVGTNWGFDGNNYWIEDRGLLWFKPNSASNSFAQFQAAGNDVHGSLSVPLFLQFPPLPGNAYLLPTMTNFGSWYYSNAASAYQSNSVNLSAYSQGINNGGLDFLGNTVSSSGGYNVGAVSSNSSYSSPYPTSVTAGLLAYWPLTEGQGAILDDISSNSLMAYVNNSPATWTNGFRGKPSLFFNDPVGTNGFLIGTNTSLQGVNALSVTFWWYPKSTNDPVVRMIVGQADTVSTPITFIVGTVTNQIVGGVYTTTPGPNSQYTTNTIALNTWTMVTYTYDGTTGRIYFGTNLLNTTTAGAATGPSASGTIDLLSVGGYSWNGKHYGGPTNDILSGLRLYTRALSSNDIYTIYEESAVQPVLIDANSVASPSSISFASVVSSGFADANTNLLTENSYAFANPLGTGLTNGWTNNLGTNAWLHYTTASGSAQPTNVIYTPAGNPVVTNVHAGTTATDITIMLRPGWGAQIGTTASQPLNVWIEF